MSKILHSFLWLFILVSYAEAKPESQFETLKVTIMDNSEKVSDTKEGVLQTTIDMEQGQINVIFSIFEADGSINKQDYTLSRYGLESWFLKTNNQDSRVQRIQILYWFPKW